MFFGEGKRKDGKKRRNIVRRSRRENNLASSLNSTESLMIVRHSVWGDFRRLFLALSKSVSSSVLIKMGKKEKEGKDEYS